MAYNKDRAHVDKHLFERRRACMTNRLENVEEAGDIEDEFRRIARATPEGADWPLDISITAVLRLVREHLAMDVVFIAHYEGRLNVFTHAEGLEMEGFAQWRAESFCQRVLDGRLPRVMPDVPRLRQSHDVPDAPVPVGAYMAAPVRLQDGSLYGTLCCFNFEPSPGLSERHYRRLNIAARLTARLIDEAAGRLAVDTLA